METDPDWAPSLHLGHTGFARRGKRQQQKRNSLQTAEMDAYQSDDNDQPHTEEEAHVESGQVCTEGDPGESGQENTTHNTSQDVADSECNLCLLRRSEVNRLLEENGSLWRELDESRMSDSFFGDDDDDKVKYYTGLPGKRAGVWERRERPAEEDTSCEEAASITNDHDYAAAPVVDLASDENKALRSEIDQLRKQVQTLHLKQRFGLHRFSGSDRDIRFFTRFGSYDLLMRFWTLIEPAVPSMVSVTQAQRGNFTESTLPARDLADRYGVHQSTVSRIITTWSHFLYTVLGSVRTWIPEEKIRENLPAEFKDYADTTVILDCIELRCQCPTSPLLQSEVFSAYTSHCTLKGLLGVAPHGAVTFISPLFAGSISDKQITRESGILSLLKPGMAIMVDRGFLVDDFVPCKIYRPAFLSGRSQMPACEVRETQAIARLRVHVERLIRRVKEHKFLDTEIPLRLFGNINQLYTVACLLTNYENGPLVKSWSKKPE
ncbi:uncharacterized protein LKV04_015974 [Tautogolabrus adspersus]